jgi:hypothetical protein
VTALTYLLDVRYIEGDLRQRAAENPSQYVALRNRMKSSQDGQAAQRSTARDCRSQIAFAWDGLNEINDD